MTKGRPPVRTAQTAVKMRRQSRKVAQANAIDAQAAARGATAISE